MRHDIHPQAISALKIQEIANSLKDAKEALEFEAVTLTAAERHEILKMGPKTLAFVEKAHEFAEKNPSLRPPYLNMQNFNDDFNDAHNLWGLLNTATQIVEMLSDTAMAAGSDAYHASLVFYNSVKVAAQQDIPGAKAVYEELQKRFPRGRRNASSDSGGSSYE
jgi:hypothetical protein